MTNYQNDFFKRFLPQKCGFKALIFEEMANRTNLTYRSLQIDGSIDKDGFVNDHRWTEILLENGDWAIVDIGFNLLPPNGTKYDFTENHDFLIGHVSIIENEDSFTDCTSDYVRNVGKLKITILQNDSPVKNANVSIKMHHKESSCDVVGRNLKAYTNESGIYEADLGIYENVNYSLTASLNDSEWQFTKENIVFSKDKLDFVIDLQP